MTGGGTGGHVNPAIAIANTIKRNNPDAEILFVGTKKGIENKLCTAEGYPIKHVEIKGFRRSLSLSNINAAYLAFVSPMRAKRLVRDFAPDIVIGTGGYVCWPVLVAASKLGIPTAVHESNAFPGVAVRRLQPYVDRIWLNFAESEKYLTAKEKILHVGNPLRSSFNPEGSDKAKEELGIKEKYDFYILSYGGSMGAEKVNDACLELMRDLGAKNSRVLHRHATGAIEWEEASKKFKEYGLEGKENLILSEYIYDMPRQMAAADIVISRAGAMTVSELALMRKASIMIPSPNVAENHQYKNAKVIADKGGTVLLEEKELFGGTLKAEVERLMNDSGKREKMGNAVAAFADRDANKVIYGEILELIKQKGASK